MGKYRYHVDWKLEVMDFCISQYVPFDENDPHGTLHSIATRAQEEALDPSISKEARELATFAKAHWKPIDTAPKNGKRILVRLRDHDKPNETWKHVVLRWEGYWPFGGHWTSYAERSNSFRFLMPLMPSRYKTQWIVLRPERYHMEWTDLPK